MILDSLYAQNSILGSALQASAFRNQIISNNIANGDTPGFKKSVVEFEDSLKRALDKSERSGFWDFRGVTLRRVKPNENFKYRADENNVDMEAEMTELYKNSAKYDALTAALTNNGRRLNLVLQGRQ